MDNTSLETSLERAERALDRIERSLASPRAEDGRDEALRARVREAVDELDQLIRLAEADA